MKKVILSFLLFLLAGGASAQEHLLMYNMETIPQRTYANPALRPFSKVNIGLPVISYTYLSFGNSGFRYNDLIRRRADDSLYVDPDNMISKLKENNYITSNVQTDLLSFSFQVKKNFFMFNATEKASMRFRYPKDLMSFVWRGNGALIGEELDFNLGLDMTHYREYGLGYNREINEKLTVGGKVKYLYGMENVWTERSDVTLTTDPKYFALTASSDIRINTAGLDSAAGENMDNTSSYLFGRKNTGFGIDLGGVYKINDKITVSASAIDIGYINWKSYVKNYVSREAGAQFTYEGIKLGDFINDSSTVEDAFDSTFDSLGRKFAIDSKQESYKTWLSPQFYLGGNYHINDFHNAGIVLYGTAFDKSFHPGISLSFNSRVKRWLGASIAYSAYNRSFTNLGAGISLNAGPVQFYFLSNNIFGMIFPQSTKNIHFQALLNLTFGRKKMDKDKDGITDKKDDCPEVPGVAELKGCPDKDGDKIADKDDSCPDVAGLPEFKGCPDKDGDKIADKDDSCPDEAGLPEFAGCPDKDSDKIIDKEDECPEEAGLVEMKGCPDKDSDGVRDKDDLCPEKAGPKENNGCPQIKLHLLDAKGNILKSAVRAEDGSFSFDNLPSDESAMFKLEGEDTEILKEVNVKVGGANKKAIRGADNMFKFPIIKPEETKLEKDKEPEVAIKLDKKEAEILKKAFDNLEFESGKDIIKPSSLTSLNELGDLMEKKPEWRIRISGHTDNQGSGAANMKLSQKRAEAVKKYLISQGVKEDRFVVKWYGPTKPIADNKTAEGRQKNRRVEMTIIE